MAAELNAMLTLPGETCRITEEGIVIRIPGESDRTYPIALSRCDSYEKIIGWVTHLHRKSWVTPRIIGDFVYTACTHHGLDPHPRN